jgi:hypothetical protein
MVDCPIECVRDLEEVDFLQRHGSWLLTVIGGVSMCLAMVLTYFLKSRCKQIRICGLACEREVVELHAPNAVITSNTTIGM